jgi:hypothetical protein
MRASTLRTLLKELRAGGVSEYSETREGVSISLKLGVPPAGRSASTNEPTAKAAQAVDTESARKRQEMLAELEITEDQLGQALKGIS